ncbi:MAG: DUF2207 domain-containing protein [Patescibacteria group bacterium]
MNTNYRTTYIVQRIKLLTGLFFVLLTACGFWLMASSVQAQSYEGQEIKSFNVEADLDENRLLKIREEIVYDFGDWQKHGIFRSIPDSYIRDGIEYNLNFKITKVLRDGEEEEYQKSSQGNSVVLKIGRADVEITGPHTYVIEYETKKAINFFEGHTELYWNVTGNQWPLGITESSFELNSPLGNSTSSLAFICYTGHPGSIEESCELQKTENGLSVTAKRALNAGEGLTVVFGFPPGVIYEPTWKDTMLETFKDNWVLLFPLIALAVMLYLWSTKGKDPEPETIIPRYEVPRGLKPLVLSAALGNGAIPQRGITATIIDLARKGYLHIKYGEEKKLLSTKQTYTFVKKNVLPESAKQYEKKLWNGLFDGGKREETSFDDLKKDKFYSDVQSANSAASRELKEMNIFDASPYAVRSLYIVGAGVVGTIVAIIGSDAPIGTAVGFATFIVIAVIGWFMPRRTKDGTSIVAEVKGFKWFLGVTEEERLKFHNAPARTPDQFMEFLPAAIALGVEKEWAEQFKDLAIEPPEWAEGNVSSWTPVILASAISDMNSASAATVYSPPSSTAGGGGSGFSGGGSGGGFGGGGGGSW